MTRRVVGALALTGMFLFATHASAGSIYLTGHDVLLHNGQRGYDAVILDYLRAAGTGTEQAKADIDIAVVGSGVGFASFTGGANFTSFADPGADGNAIPLAGTVAGYKSATYYWATTADWATLLDEAELLIIESHTSCGGCDISDADELAIQAQAGAIATAFNAGLNIWGQSGASSADYYLFLPPGAVATGAPIGGSSGFDCTAAGAAIGIVGGASCSPASPSMINGFPTHNRFTAFDSDFTVFEVRPQTVGPDEIISIGIRDARIEDDIIVDEDGDDGDGGDGTVPEPATLALLGTALAGAMIARRRRHL